MTNGADKDVGVARRSLAAQASGADRLLGVVILAAAGLLVLGWVLPIMTVERLLFLTERVSILEGCLELWAEGQYFLFTIIVVFSIVFPLLKLAVALHLWYRAENLGPALQRSLGWMEAVGRWSMLDVFVVALVVVAIQISIISDVRLHAGLYVFTAAVVLSMLVVRRITVLARRSILE